jgi:hypothetical protein
MMTLCFSGFMESESVPKEVGAGPKERVDLPPSQ